MKLEMDKKKIAILFSTLLVCCLLAIAFAVWRRQAQEPTPREQAYEVMERIEGALAEMDDEWKKQSVTEATPITYADKDGNTIVYYLCETTYYDTDLPKSEGLNIDAVKCVFDPENAESSRECKVNDLEAILYEIDERAYLCWTLKPEYTCILKYTPGTFEEEEIFKMAESVGENTEN